MSLPEFERINQEIIETEKALRERDKVLEIMASIDEQLLVEKRRLPKLLAEKHYKNYDVRELEEFTFKSIYHALRRNRDEELESEAQALLQAKIDVETCQTKIFSLENNLVELEITLVELAENDEQLAALEQERVLLISQIEDPKAKFLKIVSEELTTKELTFQGTERACVIGKQVLKELNLVIEIVKKPFLESNFLFDAAIQGSTELEPILVQFDQAVETISQKLWTYSEMKTPQFKEMDFILGHFFYDFANPKENKRLAREWLSHLQQLQKRVWSKVEVLEIELVTLGRRIEQLRTEKQQMLDEFWKPSKFS